MKLKLGKRQLAGFTALSVLAFGTIYSSLLFLNDRPSDAATASCYGQPATHTSVVPKSVTPGQIFKITNITGSANTSIATVSSVTITYAVSGATPATVTQSWTGGPVHGDYTSSYPDVTLTATGKVGDTITMNTQSIVAKVSIAGVDQTLTCSVDNGQLTANDPGQSLTVASVKIVAPNTTSTPAQKSTPTATTQKSVPATQNPAQSSDQTSTTTSSAIDGQNIEIRVMDHKGNPIKDAKVIVDSIPATKTDASGLAYINDIDAGSHNLSVTANGKTITQVFNATNEPGSVLGVSVHMPAPSHKLRNIIMAVVAGLIVLTAGMITLVKLKPKPKADNNTPAENAEPPVVTNIAESIHSIATSVTEPTVIQPQNNPPSPQPIQPTPVDEPQIIKNN